MLPEDLEKDIDFSTKWRFPVYRDGRADDDDALHADDAADKIGA